MFRFQLSEKLVREGRKSFIFKYGILGFGLPSGFGTMVVIYGLKQGFSLQSFASWEFLVVLLVGGPLVGVIAGYLWGLTMWKEMGGDESD